MSYTFKCYTDGNREYFQWECNSRLFETKSPIKKDFEFTQSLLDLIDMDFDNRFDYFNAMGEDIKRLCAGQDEDGNVRFLKKCFDELAEEHIFFQFLRLDWFERLTKYLERDYEDASVLMPYKAITHIPMNFITWQNQIKLLFDKAFDGTVERTKTIQSSVAALYGSSRRGTLELFDFKPLSTGFERVNSQTMAEVYYPKSMGDILDFILREIVKRETNFKVCKSCGKYFPAIAHGNTEFCNRLFQDTGKTCRDIGSLTKWKEKVAASPAILLYNKYYKTRFSRIRAGKITREVFQEWAALAREYRDKVTVGEMKLEDFEDWLKSGRWV